MAERIVINPLTRISGFLEVEAVIENGIITKAFNSGLMFRGFEKILLGRSPIDAIYFTERICGICSAAHSLASTLALENAFEITPSEQGRILRDFIHGCEFLQNHIRHFYQYTLPDYVKLPEKYPLFDTVTDDFRLPKAVNQRLAEHYFESLKISMQAHELQAVLGGKAPHNHGIFIGGVSAAPNAASIAQMKSLLRVISAFVNEKMAEDAQLIAHYYGDYYNLGCGCGNLLSYGCFDRYDILGTLYLNPSVMTGNTVQPFNEQAITESIDFAWYTGKDTYEPFETVSEPDMNKQKAYSWIKAPRYNRLPFEVGPLARQILSGCYPNHRSAMDRTVARVRETQKIAKILSVLLDHMIPNTDTQSLFEIPRQAKGFGLVDTTRGALAHFLKINNSEIAFYQIITPSVWNFSSYAMSSFGPSEQALIGTPIRDVNHPVEVGRILRSFDPCVSCATHIIRPGNETKTYRVVS